MLQCGQYSALNHAAYSFLAYSTYNYGQKASFVCFNLTNISQCDHYASVLNYIEIVLLNQL